MTDGWSNVNREPIIAYCSCSPTHSIFIESIATGSISHNGQFLSDDIKRVITNHPHICGICTDSASANKTAWIKVKTDYPHLFCYGCQAHALNLLVKDIFMTKRETSCLEIRLILHHCIVISKFFRSHPIEFQKYSEMYPQALTFKIPCETRWGTIGLCIYQVEKEFINLNSYLNNRLWLNEGTKTTKKAKTEAKLAISSINYQFLVSVCDLIRLIDREIKRYQSDSLPISEVLPCWKELEISSNKIELNENLSGSVITKIRSRWEFIASDVHYIAYLLDPRFFPFDYMTTEYRDYYERMICDFKIDNIIHEERNLKVYSEYIQFRLYCQDLHENNHMLLRLLKSNSMSLMNFWLNYKQEVPNLFQIASRIFSLVCTTASAERCFSVQGFIHSKFRNRLEPDTVMKLAYIKTNMKYIVQNADDDSMEPKKYMEEIAFDELNFDDEFVNDENQDQDD